ncbi:hypothetical protein C8Q77DRAFT_114694 [Trametes polyzona]|nr:hypothetical protein C8Q77DRAFT_114694 [Trametes polyzona]
MEELCFQHPTNLSSSVVVMALIACYTILPIVAATATLVNRTIDDQYGDSVTGVVPIYSPSEAWNFGPTCSICLIYATHSPISGRGAEVDSTKTFKGTWHDTTFQPKKSSAEHNVTITFVGQAVYVFNLIGNVAKGTITATNLSFTLDGTLSGYYSHVPDPHAPQLVYDVLVYSSVDLPHTSHTLVISTYGGVDSLILFDYVIYTVDEDDLSGTTSLSSSLTTTRWPSSLPADASSSSSHVLADTTVAPSLRTSASSARPISPDRPSTSKRSLVAGVVVAVSSCGILIILSVVLCALRRHRQPRRTRSVHLDTGSELRGAPATSSMISSSEAPPSPCAPSSAGMSIVARHPDSRAARSNVVNSMASSPTLAAADYAARVRLFEKITAAPRAPPLHTATRARPARTRFLPQPRPGDSLRTIRAQLAQIRGELEEFRTDGRPLLGGGELWRTPAYDV